MKRTKIFTLVSLACVGGVLASCANKEQVSSPILNYVSRSLLRADLKEDLIDKGSQVYLTENGTTLKINDPDDPTVNVVDRLEISSPVLSLYYTDQKGKDLGDTHKLSVTGYPKKAPLGTITWTSSNPSIATVDSEGLVTPVSEGLAVVTATSSGGKSVSSKVYVNNTNVLMSEAAKSAATILQRQNDPSFNTPKVIKVNQIYDEVKTRDGVAYSSSKASQTMWASSEDSYFRLVVDDESTLTSGGSIVKDNTEYVFYTTKDYSSYVFSTSNGKANYMTLDQSSLVDKGLTPFDGLAEVLQSFFVAGAKIMTNQFSSILSQDQLVAKGYSGADYKGSFGKESGEFAFTKVTQDGGRVGPEDAAELDIPSGVTVQIDDNIRYLFADNLLKSKVIQETISYEYGGSAYQNILNIVYTFYSEDVDIWWPEVSQFSKVDTIFDL